MINIVEIDLIFESLYTELNKHCKKKFSSVKDIQKSLNLLKLPLQNLKLLPTTISFEILNSYILHYQWLFLIGISIKNKKNSKNDWVEFKEDFIEDKQIPKYVKDWWKKNNPSQIIDLIQRELPLVPTEVKENEIFYIFGKEYYAYKDRIEIFNLVNFNDEQDSKIIETLKSQENSISYSYIQQLFHNNPSDVMLFYNMIVKNKSSTSWSKKMFIEWWLTNAITLNNINTLPVTKELKIIHHDDMQLKHTLDKKKNNEQKFLEYIKNIQMSTPTNNRILVIQYLTMLKVIERLRLSTVNKSISILTPYSSNAYHLYDNQPENTIMMSLNYPINCVREGKDYELRNAGCIDTKIKDTRKICVSGLYLYKDVFDRKKTKEVNNINDIIDWCKTKNNTPICYLFDKEETLIDEIYDLFKYLISNDINNKLNDISKISDISIQERELQKYKLKFKENGVLKYFDEFSNSMKHLQEINFEDELIEKKPEQIYSSFSKTLNIVEKRKNIKDEDDSLCQHWVDWKEVDYYKNRYYNLLKISGEDDKNTILSKLKYNNLKTKFIIKYITETDESTKICKSCGCVFYMQDVDKNVEYMKDSYVVERYPVLKSIEDITIEKDTTEELMIYLEKRLEMWSKLVNLRLYIGQSSSQRIEQIDFFINWVKYILSVYNRETNNIVKKSLGIENSMWIPLPLNNNLIKEDNERVRAIKVSLLMTTFITVLVPFVTLNEIINIPSDIHKDINYNHYKENKNKIFKNMFVNVGKKIDILSCKTFSYLIYIYSALIIKAKIWMNDEINHNFLFKKRGRKSKKNTKPEPIDKKLHIQVVSTMLDCFNSILNQENVDKFENPFIYNLILTTKSKWEKWKNNDKNFDNIMSENMKEIKKQEEELIFVDTENFDKIQKIKKIEDLHKNIYSLNKYTHIKDKKWFQYKKDKKIINNVKTNLELDWKLLITKLSKLSIKVEDDNIVLNKTMKGRQRNNPFVINLTKVQSKNNKISFTDDKGYFITANNMTLVVEKVKYSGKKFDLQTNIILKRRKSLWNKILYAGIPNNIIDMRTNTNWIYFKNEIEVLKTLPNRVHKYVNNVYKKFNMLFLSKINEEKEDIQKLQKKITHIVYKLNLPPLKLLSDDFQWCWRDDIIREKLKFSKPFKYYISYLIKIIEYVIRFSPKSIHKEVFDFLLPEPENMLFESDSTQLYDEIQEKIDYTEEDLLDIQQQKDIDDDMQEYLDQLGVEEY